MYGRAAVLHARRVSFLSPRSQCDRDRNDGFAEAKLAREAEMCYAMLAMGTDYDCWHEAEEDVSVEAVVSVLKTNAEHANQIVCSLAALLPRTSDCDCLNAAQFAIITSPDAISSAAKERLSLLYDKYWA